MEKPNWAPAWSHSNTIRFMRCWGQEGKESTHKEPPPRPGTNGCPTSGDLSPEMVDMITFHTNHHKSAAGWLPAAACAGQALFWLELRPHQLGMESQYLSSSNYSVIPMKNHLYYLCTPLALQTLSFRSVYMWNHDASSLFSFFLMVSEV